MIFISVSDTSRRYGDQAVNEINETPRSLFEKLGVNYERSQTSLNGTILTPGQMDMTFAQLGITTRGVLSSIVKGDGAMVFVSVSDTSRRYGDQAVNEQAETPRSLFDKLGVAYERAQISLNGAILTPGQMDMTFGQLGITTRGALNAIVKGDGAAK